MEAVQVRELARSLGVSAPALYKHVRGREEVSDRLVAACLDEAAADVAAARDTADLADPRAGFLAAPLAAWAEDRRLPVTVGQVHTVVSAFGDLLGLVAVDVFGRLGFALPETDLYLDRRLVEPADRVAA